MRMQPMQFDPLKHEELVNRLSQRLKQGASRQVLLDRLIGVYRFSPDEAEAVLRAASPPPGRGRRWIGVLGVMALAAASIVVLIIYSPDGQGSEAPPDERAAARSATPTTAPATQVPPTNTAVTLPTSTPDSALQGAVIRPGDAQVTRLELAANHIIYDPVSERIYASVPSRVGVNGNSVAVIDPRSGVVGPFIFAGSEPAKLAVSDDGRFLYVSLEGVSAVRRVDLSAQAADIQFALAAELNRHVQAADIEVLPGRPESVAISLEHPGLSPDFAGVVVYDNGVERPVRVNGFGGTGDHVDVIEFSSSSSRIYGASDASSPTRFYRLDVDEDGVSIFDDSQDLLPGSFSSGDIEFASGRIYTGDGAVIDPEERVVLGRYDARGLVAPDPVRGVTYVLQDRTLFVFARDTFVPLARLDLADATGRATDLVLWGQDGLAVNTDSDTLYLLRVPMSVLPPVPSTAVPRALPTATPTSVRVESLVLAEVMFDDDISGQSPETGGMGQPDYISTGPGTTITVETSALGIETRPAVLTSSDGYVSLQVQVGPVRAAVVRVEATVSFSQLTNGYFLQTTDGRGAVITRLISTTDGELLDEFGGAHVGDYSPGQPFQVRMDVDMSALEWSLAVDNEMNGFDDDPVAEGLLFANRSLDNREFFGVGASFNPSLINPEEPASIAYDDIRISVLGP